MHSSSSFLTQHTSPHGTQPTPQKVRKLHSLFLLFLEIRDRHGCTFPDESQRDGSPYITVSLLHRRHALARTYSGITTGDDRGLSLQLSAALVFREVRLAFVVPSFKVCVLGDGVHVALETRQVLLLLGNIDEFLSRRG
jgi:hypothetical protein